MTSTEFAARYRLLKNVATRGARSFLAQQVELGRMVMVHYLDSEKPQERAATLARLEALTPPARNKLLEIVDVDGSPIGITKRAPGGAKWNVDGAASVNDQSRSRSP